jgi:histone acetyltransferase (RNA polymerase elongator complex component)
VYCDQRTISGASQSHWNPGSIRGQVQEYLDNTDRYPVQVAFYGGSFTLLPQPYQRLLLESVQEFLQKGRVQSLRLSTRPDGIEDGDLRFLRSMGVKTIELGVQSLNDRVLTAAARGHSSRQVYEAVAEIRRCGFELGLQLMPGLPKDTRKTFLRTVDQTIYLHPDFVRLYPTVVLADTPLERLYHLGRYLPLSLKKAIDWCRAGYQRFALANIPVVRMGLQPTGSLEQPGRIVAGPYHPAFGHLVKSAIWYEQISPTLALASRRSRHLVIQAQPNNLAEIRGHRNSNLERWINRYQLLSLTTAGSALAGAGSFRVTTR